MGLETYIRNKLEKKDILLMTHIVLGYPSLKDSFRIIETMVNAGVDLMELQIPFSEPVADGPVILKANQVALRQGVTVRKCLDFVEEMVHTFEIPFFVMTYYNIIFKLGVERFVSEMAKSGLIGAIVPDLPPEEGREYLETMQENELASILIFSPATPFERMGYLAAHGRGFIYCISRRGVTGKDTRFSEELDRYLSQCRKATPLPLALGFGVKEKADIDFLKGKADIAVIGTQTIRVIEEKGIASVADFVRSLR